MLLNSASRRYNVSIIMMRKVFPVLALATFSSMLGVGIIAPLLPLYAEKLGATDIWIGVIFASFSISRSIFMPFVGRLSDRYGRKRLITIGILVYSIISLGYVWADNVSQLTIIRLIHGAASGMIIPIAQAYIGEIAPEGEEGKWMGYFNAAFFSGFGFGPLLGGVLTEHFGMNFAFYSMGGLNLLAFLIAVFFLPEIKHRKMAINTSPSFKEIGESRIIRGLFIFRLSFAMGREGAFFTFLPIFAALSLGLNSSLTGVLLAVNILLMSILQLYGGKLADRFKRRTLITIGGIINVLFLALIPLTHNFWQLLGLSALGGIGGSISMPAASALSVEEGRRFGMSSTIALIFMAMSIGMVIGPILGGVLAESTNINSVFYFSAAALLAGTGLFMRLTK